jgi:nucleoid-associated protein YgaU
VPGDNLWRIARARIEASAPQRATDGEIVRYWRRLVDANRTTLRSGDPNLIFPGEILRLPPAL